MRGWLRELDLSDLATVQRLVRVGALPSDELRPDRSCSNIVEGLVDCWESALSSLSGPRIKRARQLIAALKVLDPRCCRMAVWQPPDGSTCRDCLLFAPRGLPNGQWLSLPSSRLVRKLDFEQAWLGALRVVVEDAASRGSALLTVNGTASDRFVKRAGRVFGVPVVAVSVDESAADRAAWFARVLDEFAMSTQTTDEFPVFMTDDNLHPGLTSVSLKGKGTEREDQPHAEPVPQRPSPPAPLPRGARGDNHGVAQSSLAAPLRDWLLLQLADEVTALAVRADGHCFRLLLDRLRIASPRTQVINDERLTRRAVLSELLDQGVEFKSLDVSPPREDGAGTSVIRNQAEKVSQQEPNHRPPDFELPMCLTSPNSDSHEASDWVYLTHWTRGLESLALRDMPDDLLDDWLRQPRAVDRTALTSLQRILQSGRIIARRQSAHDAVPVVCFSAAPLKSLLEKRTYRAHRTRWDAEPFGLCIRREALKKLGARPVIYGDDAVRKSLADEDRLWFQPLISQTRTSTIDWSIEQEWRLPGDLNLEWLGPDDAFVFVRASEDAEQLKNVSHWPIMVVGR